MRVQNNFGELMTIDGAGRTITVPTFTCGHCSNVTVMHPGRTRPRSLCKSCMKWICEEKPICHAQCTPIHALAEDGFMDKSSHSRLVHAIMSGAQSIEEAAEKGLIILP